MIYQGFIGASDGLSARTVSVERTINFYPEIATGTPKARTWLVPTPGLDPFVVLEAGPVRALFAEEGRCFAVGGTSFVEILADQTAVGRGPVADDGLPASISSNGSDGHQLFVVAGGEGFIFNLETNAFTHLDAATAPDFPRPCRMGALSMATPRAEKRERYVPDFRARGRPVLGCARRRTGQSDDRHRPALVAVHREVWLLGSSTTTVWADIGDPDFPFAPIPGAFIQQGLIVLRVDGRR